MGMTGLVTGNHLHYEIHKNGQQIDPLSVDLPAGDPVPSDDRDRWRTEMTSRVTLLESIPRAGPVRTATVAADQELAPTADIVAEDPPGGVLGSGLGAPSRGA